MVAACLNKNADRRPSAADLLREPVLKHAHDSKWLAKRLLSLDRSARRISWKDDVGASTHSLGNSPNPTPPVRHCNLYFLSSAMRRISQAQAEV